MLPSCDTSGSQTWSTSWTGTSASSQGGNGSYVRNGNMVTISMPAISAAAANATQLLPHQRYLLPLYQVHERDFPIVIENNNNWGVGNGRITTGGAFTVYPSFSSTNFTATNFQQESTVVLLYVL